MILVPLTVFVLIVVFALGGPTSFMMTVSQWASEIGSFLYRWLRSL